MIAEPYQPKRVIGELPLQSRQEIRIVLRAHGLPPQILIDQWSVSRILPLRHQVGPVAIVPGKMIGGEIDEDEHWTARMFVLDHARRSLIKETVGFDPARAEIMLAKKCWTPVVAWKLRALMKAPSAG